MNCIVFDIFVHSGASLSLSGDFFFALEVSATLGQKCTRFEIISERFQEFKTQLLFSGNEYH